MTLYEVIDVRYSVHIKRETGSKSMRVDYFVGPNDWKSEWICFEHTGFARYRAVVWWKRRSPDPVPDAVERAVDIANNGGVALTRVIVVVPGQFDRIVAYALGTMPEPAIVDPSPDLDQVPF